MTTTITLNLDGNHSAEFQKLVAEAVAAGKGLDKVAAGADKADKQFEEMVDSAMGVDEVTAEVVDLRQEVDKLGDKMKDTFDGSSKSVAASKKQLGDGTKGGGGMFGSVAKGLLTVELLKKGFELVTRSIEELAEEGAKGFDEMNDAIKSPSLTLKEMLRNAEDLGGALSLVGEGIKFGGDVIAVAGTGKTAGQLAGEDLERARKRALKLSKDQFEESRKMAGLESASLEKLKVELKIADDILTKTKGKAGGLDQANRLANRHLAIQQKIFDIEKGRREAGKAAAKEQLDAVKKMRAQTIADRKELDAFIAADDKEQADRKDAIHVQEKANLEEIEDRIKKNAKLQKQADKDARMQAAHMGKETKERIKEIRELRRAGEVLAARKKQLTQEQSQADQTAHAKRIAQARSEAAAAQKKAQVEFEALKKRLQNEQKLKDFSGKSTLGGVFQAAGIGNRRKVAEEIARQRSEKAGREAEAGGGSKRQIAAARRAARVKTFRDAQRGKIGAAEVIGAQKQLVANVLSQGRASGNFSNKVTQALGQAALEQANLAELINQNAEALEGVMKSQKAIGQGAKGRAQGRGGQR
jgi:hypothetical protein